MKNETKKFDITNTLTLNIDGETFNAKINVNGQNFEAILQKQKSKIGTTYIFWRDGENSLYIFNSNNTEKENTPQMTGNLQYKNTEYKIALWHKKGISKRTGKEYAFYSGKVSLPQPKQVETETNDDLPF